MVGCKCIICRLTEMVEDELSKDVYEDMLDHIEHCVDCHSLYNTFIKTLDLFHHIERVKLPSRKKKSFHRWIHIEAQKVFIKRKKC